ncbi:unnamed protein product [Somion occarium]|uniref:Cytochrome P450 n=1 Tax=Somion occarium TaxID=3059160 RepID=A0ABP1DM79_9APHY
MNVPFNSSIPFSFSDEPFTGPWQPADSYLECLQPLVGGVVAFFVTIFLSRYSHSSGKGKLPPGPSGVPFFGSLFQLMTTPRLWITFANWGKQYGPLIHLKVAGKHMIIMNNHKVAADLLDRRASNYSSRPNFIVASEMLTGGLLLPFQGYTDLWRTMRRAAHEGLNSSAARHYHAAQEKEATLIVQGMLKDSNNWDDELKRATSSMILGVIYDTPTIESCHDPKVAYVNDFVIRFVSAASPGAHYVEYFTWMKYLPSAIAKWKREALEWYRRDSIYLGKMYAEVQERIKQGEDINSFAATLIRDERQLGLDNTQSAWLAATIYAAGSETTSTVMAWFMLAMLAYPEVQRKAQEELDTVIGRGRMPTIADRDRLPYISACVREALRWRSLTPIGAPHQSVEDDWYDGYFIPKGTICIANQWAMNSDPDVYGPDADEFNPRRHLDEHEHLTCPFPDTHDGHVSYGFGRRICVGRHVANNGLFINMASLLWATTIMPTTDAQGKPVIPDTHDFINNGLVLRPLPFKCKVKPRFPEAEAIVAQTRELSQA